MNSNYGTVPTVQPRTRTQHPWNYPKGDHRRYSHAYAIQLCEIDQDHELPQSLIAAFDRFKDAISDAKMPYGYGEHAAKKLNDMSEDDASALAREIFNIFLKLQESELR